MVERNKSTSLISYPTVLVLGSMVFPECLRAWLQVPVLPSLFKAASGTRDDLFVCKGFPNQMREALNGRILRFQCLLDVLLFKNSAGLKLREYLIQAERGSNNLAS